jgi:hypothetical protein
MCDIDITSLPRQLCTDQFPKLSAGIEEMSLAMMLLKSAGSQFVTSALLPFLSGETAKIT